MAASDHDSRTPAAASPVQAGTGALALHELLEQHAGPLRTYLRCHLDPLLRARESCSDMVQSVFRECLADAGRVEFRHEAAFRKWLFQKALSKVLDRRRYWLADKRDPRLIADAAVDAVPAASASVSGLAIRNEDLEALEQCFDELSPEHRQVIVAARLIGQSHAEIAAETGRSVEAVGMLLHRALARLARLMHARGRPPGV
ncbi:MAG: sigma-70 family RNA polymerase sigma factor [Planctomycetota bacterium]